MTTRSPFLVRLTAVCLAVGSKQVLQAQQTPPPVDPKAVLTALKDLRAKQQGLINREKGDVLAAINAAIADPGKAYERAIESVELQGQAAPAAKPVAGPGALARAGTRVVDTRKRVGDQTRDRDFVNGLRLQLIFLSLTWQRSMGVKTRDLIPALLDYVGQINQSLETLQTLEMFPHPIKDSVFVDYFQIGPYINGLPDWPDHAFDTDGIYQKTILPEMRRNKDPRLLSYWDNLIQTDATRAATTQNSLLTARFAHIRRPSLLWGRAEDEAVLGNANQAVADMLADLKANPDHPDFDKWAAELEGVVNAKAAPAVVGDAAGGATVTSPALGTP